MDNERKDFNLEEQPIGIKPLEDNGLEETASSSVSSVPKEGPTDEIKLVRETPVEAKPESEVKVVNSQQLGGNTVRVIRTGAPTPVPVKTASAPTPEAPKVEKTPIPPTPVKNKKKIQAKDVIMYIVMVIIIILIIFLLMVACGSGEGKMIKWPKPVQNIIDKVDPETNTSKKTTTKANGVITISTTTTRKQGVVTMTNDRGEVIYVTSTTTTTNPYLTTSPTGNYPTLPTRTTSGNNYDPNTSTTRTTKTDSQGPGQQTRTTSTTKKTSGGSINTTKSTTKTTSGRTTSSTKKTSTTTKTTKKTSTTKSTTKTTSTTKSTTTTTKSTTTSTTKAKTYTYTYTEQTSETFKVVLYENGVKVTSQVMVLVNGNPVAFGTGTGITINRIDINMANEPTITFAFYSNPSKTFTAKAQ